MQIRWIERLFTRLQAMYGSSFNAMWANTNLIEVKTIWAEKLGGFCADQFAAALLSLEDRENYFPPSLPEFLQLCRNAARARPAGGQYIEPAPATKEESAKFIAEAVKRAPKSDNTDSRGWAKRMIDRKLAGERVPYAALKMAQEVYRMPT